MSGAFVGFFPHKPCPESQKTFNPDGTRIKPLSPEEQEAEDKEYEKLRKRFGDKVGRRPPQNAGQDNIGTPQDAAERNVSLDGVTLTGDGQSMKMGSDENTDVEGKLSKTKKMKQLFSHSPSSSKDDDRHKA